MAPPPWPRDLLTRRGARERLLGMRIYHDFPWTEVFPNRRTQFKHGLSLARLVREECPPGLEPAILLTTDEDTVEGGIESEGEYVVVVNIVRYLAQPSVDAAASYYAHRRHRITQRAAMEEIRQSPDLLQALLQEHLTIDLIDAWRNGSPERREALRELALHNAELDAVRPTAQEIVDALLAIDDIPDDVWRVLVAFLPDVLDENSRKAILDAITEEPGGRQQAAHTLGGRLAERIADTYRAIDEYETLLGTPGTTESDLQGFIELHPWLISLDYTSITPRRVVPRGELDFCLERFDGYYDILELKGPSEPIVSHSGSREELPPPANAYRLGRSLANALAQVHVYRDVFASGSALLQDQYGLQQPRDPRFVVVIGRRSDMTENAVRVLHQLNLSLHRVEILPYDHLGERARVRLQNLEAFLQPASQEDDGL